MNIFAWITLLIFIVYFTAIYSASKSGWLERHNMSLAMGFIVMWRTQRGKEIIESLAGRPTEADKIRERIAEVESDLEKEANILKRKPKLLKILRFSGKQKEYLVEQQLGQEQLLRF